MQTISRFAPPRNRSVYTYDVLSAHLTARRPDWQAMNLAEFYLWSALRFKGMGVKGQAEREANKASARFYLKLAKTLKARF